MVAVCALYLFPIAYRGWIPHDQGILAQSALRVLQGELPHRDFDELYTGGLSYLNALAYMVWGIKLSSIRTMFLLWSLVFIGVLHRVVRRLLPPGVAEITLLASLAWGLTNYFEAMPSWYNLYCIVFGLAAMLRYMDSGQTRWLIWVGFWGGASLLFKIVGLYFIAAMVLVITVDAQLPKHDPQSQRWITRWLLPIATTLVCCVWLALVLLMTRRNADTMLVTQLIVPSIAVAVAAIAIAFRDPGSTGAQVQLWIRNGAVFGLGVILPVALFLVPYVLAGSVGDLYRGLFVLPFTRLTGATYAFPSGWLLQVVVVLWICIGVAYLAIPKWDRVFAVLAVACVALVMLLPYWFTREVVLLAARMLPPALAIIGSLLCVVKNKLERTQRRQLFMLLTIAAFCSLTQFPFAAPIYFCFVATLYLVLLIQLLTLAREGAPFTAWSMACIALLLGMVYINRHSFFDDPREVALDPPIQLLAVPRGGLLVSSRDQDTYQQLVHEIQSHCQPDETLLATPDCPEVYFLSERDNPTRTFLEFFDSANEQVVSTLGLLGKLDVRVLVINLEPRHSAKLSDETVAELVEQFEQTSAIGKFLVCHKRK